MLYKVGTWIPDLPDHRDKKYSAPGPILDSLPDIVDLRDKCPPVYNQGQLGSCFPGDTLITMDDLSEKQIKDIEMGEYVTNRYGNRKKVTKKYERTYTGELYKIKFIGYSSPIYCTEEHPIAIKHFIDNKSGQMQEIVSWVKAKDIDLHERPFVIIPKLARENPSYNIISVRKLIEPECYYNSNTNKVWVLGTSERYAIPESFELTPDFARFLGLFLAEGSYRKNNKGGLNGINLTFNNKNDVPYIEFINQLIKSMFGLDIQIKRTDKRKSIIDVSISNVALANVIKKLCGEYSYGKELSPILYDQPIQVKKALIRGWLDGDGFTKKELYKDRDDKTKFRLSKCGITISNKLARGIMRLSLSCGIKPTITHRDNSKYGKLLSYSIGFYGKNVFELYPEYKDLQNMVEPQLTGKYKEDKDSYNSRITSIEKTYATDLDVYNLEVEDDHEYIANFCLVHNCTANAIGGAIQYDLKKQGLEDFTPSRLFIYYNERDMEGTVSEDAGAMIRDGVKSVNSLGVCKETTWPYDISKFRAKPDTNSYDEAKSHLAVEYSRISRNINQMRACLAEGYPFILGFSVYENFMTSMMQKTGILNLPTKRERLLGGHAVLAIGYNNNDQRFIVRNSWSDKWGIFGNFTMPYKYLMNSNLSDDFWQIKLVQ